MKIATKERVKLIPRNKKRPFLGIFDSWVMQLAVGILMFWLFMILLYGSLVSLLQNFPYVMIFFAVFLFLAIVFKSIGFLWRYSVLLVLGAFIFSFVRDEIFPSITDCNHQNLLVDAIKKEWNNPDTFISKVNVQGDYHPSFSDIQWKRDISEPYISYKGDRLSKIYFKDASLEEVSRFFNGYVASLFIKERFKKNELNSLFVNSPNPASPFFNYDFYSYGFDRYNRLYWIKLSKTNSDEDTNLTKGESAVVASLVCGKAEIKIDFLYDTFLKIPLVQENLTSYYLPTFSIGKVYNEKVVEASSSNYVYGGGVSLYFVKENNDWKQIYKGQQLPSCSLLEGNNSGPGIECIDLSTNSNRLTR